MGGYSGDPDIRGGGSGKEGCASENSDVKRVVLGTLM